MENPNYVKIKDKKYKIRNFKNMKLDLQPQDFATIIRSNGFVDGLQVPVQDALNTADGPNILSKVYTELSLVIDEVI